LFVVLVIASLLQVLFVLLILFGLSRKNKAYALPQIPEPVSIIICARNEADNLRRLLPSVLAQRYPQFEVVVVDDASTDETAAVLNDLKKQFGQLRVIQSADHPKILPAKKGALLLGQQHASHRCVLVTDADCRPVTTKWISEMVAPLHYGKEIVLGFSPVAAGNKWFQLLARWDGAWVAMQYLAFARLGMPYMGVGRNMAFDRDLLKPDFFSAPVLSGDDDLFVQHAATSANIEVVINQQAVVETFPPVTLAAWIRQKARHLQTAPHYRWWHQVLLAVYPLCHFLIFLITAILLWNNFEVVSVIALFVGRSLIHFLVHWRTLHHLGAMALWKTWWLFDWVYPLLYVTFGTTYLWRTTTHPSWK
jgi:cellulose synthase/poly-beta-1,6-N-acetylglucosamine synthase-like glycosyltransferase